MRYRWDEQIVTADGTEVARTDARFWGRTPSLTVGGKAWTFRVAPEGLVGALAGTDRLGVDRGRIWQSTWRVSGLGEELALTRTTSWLAGKLHFDVLRDGTRIAEVVPEGPWMYRPTLEVTGDLAAAEAVFLIWAAYRIDARRPLRQIRGGPTNVGSAGGV